MRVKNEWKTLVAAGVLLAFTGILQAQDYAKDTGYRGIWYYNQKTNDEYVYKYSGGLGTYCANHIPFAIYAPEANKTFFVYGGTKEGEHALLEMVSYYDHATGLVPRPTILIDKKTADAHDNPVISIDGEGHIWVFASSHGKSRPSYIFKGRNPYNVDDFEMVLETNFSYPQPWFIKGKGFFFLHTSYDGGRALYWQTSPDGREWSERSLLAHIDEGHYQVSFPKPDGSVGSSFMYHPKAFMGDETRKGLNWRTNLYYAETPDMGATWRNAAGETVEVPLETAANAALVRDYESEGLLVYIADLNFDAAGNPVILYVTARSWMPGPEHAPRQWSIAHWTGGAWAFHTITESGNNYDTGSIHIEPDGAWRVIGPTEMGPQPYNPGGEVAMWVSNDRGATWTKVRQMTAGSPYNHTYCRRPLNAHPEFYAFWADGHGRQPSESRLYISNQSGDVKRFPYAMQGETAALESVENRSD